MPVNPLIDLFSVKSDHLRSEPLERNPPLLDHSVDRGQRKAEIDGQLFGGKQSRLDMRLEVHD